VLNGIERGYICGWCFLAYHELVSYLRFIWKPKNYVLHGSDAFTVVFFLVSILFLAGSVRSVLLYSSFYFIKDGCKIPFPGTGVFCCEKLVECLFW
jgi:hypothetical protein